MSVSLHSTLQHSPRRRYASAALALSFALLFMTTVHAALPQPVLLGIDGEFGLEKSTSAQAVELGMRAAIVEINAAGGVLHGRPLSVEHLGTYRGLVRTYAPPFTPARHEALGPKQQQLARYRADGVLVPDGD